MTKIKICGIQTLEDALCLVEAGADYIGFVFAKSKRQVTPEQARSIITSLPNTIKKVGVFVNTPLQEMTAIADFCNLDILQLHGDEIESDYKDSKHPIIKAVSMNSGMQNHDISYPKADYLLFDTWHKEMRGGCGQTFEWDLLEIDALTSPFFLAGGLNIDNVKLAIESTHPYAVDVSSGVETNGVKDKVKIRQFIHYVKELEDEL